MNTLWILVYLSFTFIGHPDAGVVKMDAWKHPYPFNSQAECEEIAKESHRLAPREFFKHACIEIDEP